jgi:hypothetical protein
VDWRPAAINLMVSGQHVDSHSLSLCLCTVESVAVIDWVFMNNVGPVSGISYHPTGESNGSMQPSTRQSQNGSSVQPRVATVAYARAANNNSRPRLQDPYAITVDLESGGEPALPNTMST